MFFLRNVTEKLLSNFFYENNFFISHKKSFFNLTRWYHLPFHNTLYLPPFPHPLYFQKRKKENTSWLRPKLNHPLIPPNWPHDPISSAINTLFYPLRVNEAPTSTHSAIRTSTCGTLITMPLENKDPRSKSPFTAVAGFLTIQFASCPSIRGILCIPRRLVSIRVRGHHWSESGMTQGQDGEIS